jgi:tetratricopeptide (TPR) repeat protein
MSCIVHAEHITIYHTGYSESVHRQTGKAQRNIALLRAELKNNPDNLNLKAYLANSLSMGTDEKSQLEAMSLINEIISSKAGEHVNNVLRVKMYIFMINKYLSGSDKLPECENICGKALAAFPGTIDFMYFSAVLLSKKDEYDEAWELLKECEEKLINNNDSGNSIMIPADPVILFSQMILTAKALGDIEGIILYSTHVLTMDKTRLSILSPCIATLLHYGVSEPEVIGLLSNIYDFNDTDDLSLVIKAARDCGATAFAEGLGK